MEVNILDKKIEKGNKICHLCTFTLKEYMENLPNDFMNYNIQRGIISNIYLDNLVETVLKNAHIPPITLVKTVENSQRLITNPSNTIDISNFRILDGLQRTYRLKVIWDTILFLEENMDESIFHLSKYQISRKYNESLREINSSTSLLIKLISFCDEEENSIEELKKCYDIKQWFEVWTNLSPEDEIEKMLILNAGHKQMSLQHQLELLFLNLLPMLNNFGKQIDEDFKLFREKEITSATYSKRRKKGQFYFPHLISATLSFIEKDVITTNTNLIKKMQEVDSTYKEMKNYINYNFLEELVKFLVKLDEFLFSRYGEDGVKWISRETVMIGLFGALGKYSTCKKNGEPPEKVLEEFLFLLTTSDRNQDFLNIVMYNECRASIDLGSVNIGYITKNAIFRGIYELLYNQFCEPINWNIWFKGDNYDN